MHQSCTKLASPVSCLLGRDTYGYHYGAHMAAGKDVALSEELEPRNSSENAFSGTVSTERAAPSDMPIVGTSSQVDTSVADALRGSIAESLQDSGCASLKRERSHQDLEETRAEKRAKVETSVGLLWNSVNGNGMSPAVPQDCQDTNSGGELAKERDDLRPLVPQSTEVSTAAAPNDADLTGLLNDLDDAGDSDLDEEDYGVEWPEALCNEWLGNGSINENGVQAHTPRVETIAETLNISWELAQGDGGIGTKVQAHASQPETITTALDSSSEQAQSDGDTGTKMQAHTPQVEMITTALDFSSEQAQRDGDTGPEMQAHTPQVESITKAVDLSLQLAQRDGDIGIKVQAHDTKATESPGAEIVILLDSDSDDDDDLIMFETSPLGSTVKTEPGIRQLGNNISPLENTVKIEPESSRQLVKNLNAVKVEPESLRQQPETSYQFENAVKVEPESLGQQEKSSELVPNEISTELMPSECEAPKAVKLEFGGIRREPDSKGSRGFAALTMQDMLRAGQEQPGKVMLQTVVQDGNLVWALVPQKTDATPGSAFSVNHLHPRPPQVNGLPNGLPYGLGCSFGVASKNVRESPSSGEQAGPSHGWMPPTTSGHTQPSGIHANIAGKAVLSVPSVPIVPSPFQPACKVEEAATSGEQAGPIHGWTPPNTSAVVPYATDTTVSTPRVEVTRALHQYHFFINKVKEDRAKELLALRESTSNQLVREGNRRGLECRPDIVAYNHIKKTLADVNPGINVGDLPGVEVGDTFTYRHQMAVVGLHRLPNVGIDYGYLPPDGIPTATAIVLMPKAGYVDDKDNGSAILYTGQGGRKKRNQQAPFVCDQELKKGNLALAKNYERKLPVRVIRGHMGTGNSGPGFLGYSYDGLYTIVSYEFSDGINGYKVFKYYMERLEDQPPIPPCIAGCTAHTWNSARAAMRAYPLQALDPTTVDVKPICMQVPDHPSVDVKPICMQVPAPPVDVKPVCMQVPEPPLVEMKQICI